LKEITRDLYRVDTVEAAREVFDLLYAWADSGDVAQMRRFARTIRRWQTGIVAWHTTGGASNGPTEAVTF
jgi:transposase